MAGYRLNGNGMGGPRPKLLSFVELDVFVRVSMVIAWRSTHLPLKNDGQKNLSYLCPLSITPLPRAGGRRAE